MAKRVMVAGAIGHHPLGGAGNAWAFLQYVLGFRELGYDAYYVEHIGSDQCINDQWQRASFATSANARFFSDVMHRFDLQGQSALLQWDGSEAIGLSRRDVELLARDTAVLVNLSGRFHLDSVLGAVKRRMYIDLDPGFVQIWQERYGVDMNLHRHDVHVTVGLNMGAPDCPMPTCGINWHTTLPPVVLGKWVTKAPPGNRYTTVADWRGYSPVEWDGVWYGQKAEEFLKVIDLPSRLQARLAAHQANVPSMELCLAIHPDETDRARLEEHGWRLVSPRERAATLDGYRDYIHGSRGEFTVVKHGYAAGRTGWFSDRSACYLAAGRPVVVQDTALGAHLPCGEGLLTFTDLESAAEALARVEDNYARHAAAAAAFACEHLDSAKILPRLLEIAGVRS